VEAGSITGKRCSVRRAASLENPARERPWIPATAISASVSASQCQLASKYRWPVRLGSWELRNWGTKEPGKTEADASIREPQANCGGYSPTNRRRFPRTYPPEDGVIASQGSSSQMGSTVASGGGVQPPRSSDHLPSAYPSRGSYRSLPARPVLHSVLRGLFYARAGGIEDIWAPRYWALEIAFSSFLALFEPADGDFSCCFSLRARDFVSASSPSSS